MNIAGNLLTDSKFDVAVHNCKLPYPVNTNIEPRHTWSDPKQADCLYLCQNLNSLPLLQVLKN